MNQIVLDWKSHPITSNFFKTVLEAREAYTESIINGETGYNTEELYKRIGIIQGLDALLTYNPEVDEDGNIID